MTTFTQIENMLTADKVYRELRNAILKRVLAPGQKLDIYELAEQFQVSRTPVKEAFNRLHLEGLITIRPRKGTYVSEIDMQKVMEVLDARLLFEIWAAKVAVVQASDADIQVLRKLCKEMDECCEQKQFDYMHFNELDSQFHVQIISMGKNQSLLHLYKSLHAHRITERAYYQRAYEKFVATHHQHREIVEAFEKRDASLVVELVTRHIVDGKEGLSKTFN